MMVVIIIFDLIPIKLNKNLEIYFLDQTTPNMIQGLKGVFARKPLISRGI